MAQVTTDLATGKSTEIGLSPGQTEGSVGGEYVVRPSGSDPMSVYTPGIGSTSMRIEGGASGRGGNITTVRRDQYGNIIEITERTPSGSIVFQRGVQSGGGYVEAGLPVGVQQSYAETESQWRNLPATRQRADYFEAIQAQRKEYTLQTQVATGLGAQFDLPFNGPFVSPIETMRRQEEREYVSTLSPAEAWLFYHPPTKSQMEQITAESKKYSVAKTTRWRDIRTDFTMRPESDISRQKDMVFDPIGVSPYLEKWDVDISSYYAPATQFMEEFKAKHPMEIEAFKSGFTGGYRPERVVLWGAGSGAYRGISEKPATFAFNVAVGAVLTKGLGGVATAAPVTTRSIIPGAISTSKAAKYVTPMNIAGAGMAGLYGADVAGRIAESPRPASTTGEIIGTEIIPFGIGAGIATKLKFPSRPKPPETSLSREKPVSTKTDWYKQPTPEYTEAKYKELDVFSTGRAAKIPPREPIITSTEKWWKKPTPEYIQAKYKEFEIIPPESGKWLVEPAPRAAKTTVIDLTKAQPMRSSRYAPEPTISIQETRPRDLGKEMREKWAMREREASRMKPREMTSRGQIVLQRGKAVAKPKIEIIDLTKPEVSARTKIIGGMTQKERQRLAEFTIPKREFRTASKYSGASVTKPASAFKTRPTVSIKPLMSMQTKARADSVPVASTRAVPAQKYKQLLNAMPKQRSAQLSKAMTIPSQKTMVSQRAAPVLRSGSITATSIKLKTPQRLKTKSTFNFKRYGEKKHRSLGKFPELAPIASPEQIMRRRKFKRPKL